MPEKSLKWHRRKQILRALHLFGPLSKRTLAEILRPPMANRPLNTALKRLCDRGLLIRCHGELPKNSAHHYQLCRKENSRAEIQRILKLSTPLSPISPFRGQELHHSDACAVWNFRFKRIIPNASIIPESLFSRDSRVQAVLASTYEERSLRPDFVLRIPAPNRNAFVHIAIEVERSTKSESRLVQKPRKLVGRTELDGLIYVCLEETNGELIRKIYAKEVLPRVYRVRHYGRNFLMSLDQPSQCRENDFLMQNAANEPASFIFWLRQLIAVDVESRKDSDFEIRAHPGSK